MALREILRNEQVKLRRREKIQEEVFQGVSRRISYHAKLGHKNCVYEVPTFIFGLPLQNPVDIGEKIKRDLVVQGFRVVSLTGNYIYISWNEQDLVKNYAESKKLKEAMKQKEKEEKKKDKWRDEFLSTLADSSKTK